METRTPSFDREWELLKRALRRRALLRGLGFGALFGSIATLALALSHSFSPDFESWMKSALPVPKLWLFLPTIAGAIMGLIVARILPVEPAKAAAWGDTYGGGRDAVRTMLNSDGPFQHFIAADAAQAMERARTARVPVRGMSGSVLASVGILLASGAMLLLASFFARPMTPPALSIDDILASPKLLENAAALADRLGGAGELAEWAAEAGLERLEEAAEHAAQLAEKLAGSEMTEGDALSQVAELEKKAQQAAGDQTARAAASELMQDSNLLKTASEMMNQVSPEMIESVTNSAGFKGLMDALSRLGANQPDPPPQFLPPVESGEPTAAGPSPDGQPSPSTEGADSSGGSASHERGGAAEITRPSKAEEDFGKALSRLGELMSRSPVVRDVLRGGLEPEHGRAALQSAEHLEKTAGEMRRQIVAQASGEASADAPDSSTAPAAVGTDPPLEGEPVEPAIGTSESPLRLIDLPAVPAGTGRAARRQFGDPTSAPHLQGGDPSDPSRMGNDQEKPRVGVTGRELEASGTDFRSRANRLPSALRDAAGRYFEPPPAKPQE